MFEKDRFKFKFKRFLIGFLCLVGASPLLWFCFEGNMPSFLHNARFGFITKQGKQNQNVIQGINDEPVVVVGAGLSGAVIARLHANLLGKKVIVVEKNSHIGGSCYDYEDKYGIRVSKYGLHVLHTNNELVWRYLSQFSKWSPHEHRVVAQIDESYVPIPSNIDTINTLFNLSIINSADMVIWLKDHPSGKSDKKKSEQQYIEDLLTKTFEYHSPKGCYNFNQDLNPSRPQLTTIRDDFDDRCFPNEVHQVLPTDGYTALINQMLNHPLITVVLNQKFSRTEHNKIDSRYHFTKTFYTGPIDTYFKSSGLEKLAYRSLNFETVRVNKTVFQPNMIVDYPQDKQKYLRIVEYKHVSSKTIAGTTIVKQTFVDNGYPYYPVNDEHSKNLYKTYELLAKEEETRKRVYFVGGPARYQYFNIDETVMNAITEFRRAYADTRISFPDENISPKSVQNMMKDIDRDNPSIAFVTNHCKESLSWIPKEVIPLCSDNEINLFIYEKCGQTKTGSEIRRKYPKCNIYQIELPNVGREGHSWVHHMMTKQSFFSEINVFVQGGKEVKHKVLFDTINNKKSLDNLKAPNYFKTPSDKFPLHYSSFGNSVCYELRFNYLNWTGKAIVERNCEYFCLITRSKENCDKFIINFRGEFVVTGALLHRMLARHRKVLIRWYNDLSTGNNPLPGHIVERLWTLLFQYPIIHKC